MRVNTPTPNAHVRRFQLNTPTKNQLSPPKMLMHSATIFAITIVVLLDYSICSGYYIMHQKQNFFAQCLSLCYNIHN